MLFRTATFNVIPGKNAEFEAAFRWLMAEVKAKEAGGASLYQLVKSRTDPQAYRVVIVFRDQAAEDAHRASDHHAGLGARMVGTLVDKAQAETFDFVT